MEDGMEDLVEQRPSSALPPFSDSDDEEHAEEHAEAHAEARAEAHAAADSHEAQGTQHDEQVQDDEVHNSEDDAINDVAHCAIDAPDSLHEVAQNNDVVVALRARKTFW